MGSDPYSSSNCDYSAAIARHALDLGSQRPALVSYLERASTILQVAYDALMALDQESSGYDFPGHRTISDVAEQMHDPLCDIKADLKNLDIDLRANAVKLAQEEMDGV